MSRRKHPPRCPKCGFAVETPLLPGMEGVLEARQDAASRQMALHLTQTMQQPLGDVSARSGQIERDSPLFYGSGAGGVEVLFR